MSVSAPFSTLDLYEVIANIVPGVVFSAICLVLYLPSGALSDVTGGQAAILIVFAFVIGHGLQWLGSKIEGTPKKFKHTVQKAADKDPDDEEYKSAVDITGVEEDFWDIADKTLNIEEDFDNYGRLFQLVITKVETTPGNRASKFQSIYTFYRNMWVTFVLVVGLCILAIFFRVVRIWNC